jgi:hypothetical protein
MPHIPPPSITIKEKNVKNEILSWQGIKKLRNTVLIGIWQTLLKLFLNSLDLRIGRLAPCGISCQLWVQSWQSTVNFGVGGWIVIWKLCVLYDTLSSMKFGGSSTSYCKSSMVWPANSLHSFWFLQLYWILNKKKWLSYDWTS